MNHPHPKFGEAGPYAVYSSRRRPDGTVVEMPPSRNLDWSAAERVRDRLGSDPATVEVHISLDTCG